MMKRQIRVEIIAENTFWHNAVLVEWEYQFPGRKLVDEPDGSYLIEADWFDDLVRVAERLFSRALIAPADPSRRQWFRRLLPYAER